MPAPIRRLHKELAKLCEGNNVQWCFAEIVETLQRLFSRVRPLYDEKFGRLDDDTDTLASRWPTCASPR